MPNPKIWTGTVNATFNSPPRPRWAIWAMSPPDYDPTIEDKRRIADGTRRRFPWPRALDGSPLQWADVEIEFDHKTGRPVGLRAKPIVVPTINEPNLSPFPAEIME